jgi:hypothetical protein
LRLGKGRVSSTVGDSTTLGFGSAAEGFRGLSYPAELAQALNALGVSSQSDNFLGQGNENGDTTDERVSLSGGPAYIGWYDAGGQVIETNAAGQAISFTLNTPGDYNQLSVSYINLGSGSVTVTVDGTAVGTLQFGNTGTTLSQSIAIPAGLHGQVSLTANSASPTYIQGAAFSNSTSNQMQIFNAAIGGWGGQHQHQRVQRPGAARLHGRIRPGRRHCRALPPTSHSSISGSTTSPASPITAGRCPPPPSSPIWNRSSHLPLHWLRRHSGHSPALLGPQLCAGLPALRAAGLGSGNHGFELDLPEGIHGAIEVRRASDQAVLRFSTEVSQP